MVAPTSSSLPTPPRPTRSPPLRLLSHVALIGLACAAGPAAASPSPAGPAVGGKGQPLACAVEVAVVDAQQAPLVGAQVTVRHGRLAHLQAPTGGDGVARFAAAPCGQLQVDVRAAGHAPAARVLAAARPGERRTLRLALRALTAPKAEAAAPPAADVPKLRTATVASATGRAGVKAKRYHSTGTGSGGMVLMGYGAGGGGVGYGAVRVHRAAPMVAAGGMRQPEPKDREGYAHSEEERFTAVADKPLSTFSVDVDTASWSNLRRFVEREQRLPPVDAVRIEELVNAFPYAWPGPRDDLPFAVHTEVSVAPWSPAHRLMAIAVQGRRIETKHLPPANLVFLVDVSGSMDSYDKLPLLKASLALLVRELRAEDRVSLVVYAGAAGLVLPPTSGAEQGKILAALEGLSAGGSTAGGAGLELAYKVAQEAMVRGGNNRVILCTDGDFNVGPSSDGEMVRLIEGKREAGVFLTVLGFGTGNYQDAKMQQLAQHGNGNHAYIDTILEARRVLVEQMGGTLLTIAKDVKLQVEFNPRLVKGYRLIGYETRRLQTRDFDDDKKDAGELGAGHTVTAFYEVVPASSGEAVQGEAQRKYTAAAPTAAAAAAELATVRLRFKAPRGATSEKIEHVVRDEGRALAVTSDDFRFATAVAELGLLLRGSKLAGAASFAALVARAEAALGPDAGGHRKDFVTLARKAALLQRSAAR